MIARPHRLLALGLAFGIVLGACTRGTPDSRLAEALESLFEDAFAFSLTVEADRPSLNELGEGARAAAEFLQGLQINGVVDENEAARLDVTAFGIDNVVQLLVLGTDALYLRAAIADLAVATDTEAPDAAGLVGALTSAEVDPAVIAAVGDLLGGEWVGLTGIEDADELLGSPDESESGRDIDLSDAGRQLGEAFGQDLDGFVQRFLTVTETSDGDERRWDVELDVAELLRASNELNTSLGLDNALPTENVEDLLGGVPAVVPGTIVARNGVATEIQFDLAEAARTAGNEVSGSILVRITFDDDPPVLAAPEGVEAVTMAQIGDAITTYVAWQAEEALRQLQENLRDLQGELATPDGSG